MRQINWSRVLLGGLVAGLIIDVGQWLLNGLFLGSDWRQAMQSLGKPLAETPARGLFYILLGVAYGIMAIWLYASIRPRYGAGPITALYAGLGVWLLGDFLPALTWMPRALFPRHLVSSAMPVVMCGTLLPTVAG